MSEIQLRSRLQPGRIFPEAEWSDRKKAEWQIERDRFYQSCEEIFQQVKSELIETHYCWYVAIEPHSQDYFLAESEWEAISLARAKYSHAPFHLFQINQTGVCGAK
ncbi:hypothetical protein [Roseofilum casamattae]|uniref:Uncharacterized protein n=1 Tax=Roseofilum casamattae BLCC-M143 TaxID=3022442 RepID=A0ABT7BW16_9CYAN|nr:hypothetical protein [Roseofilum casamattae]MDJ1182453.1 hypothetical protein [Roseofilum casamattae BLCC-M143]